VKHPIPVHFRFASCRYEIVQGGVLRKKPLGVEVSLKWRIETAVISLLLLLCAISQSRACAQVQAAQAAPAPPQVADEAAIRAAMAAQTAAWNRADIPAFMQAYENSPETTFIGAHLRKGYGPILERYKQSYTTPEQMGTLTFSDLDVRLLPSSCGPSGSSIEFAVVTGTFHLERTAKGEAKKDDGIFSLVWRKGPQGWKILLDHTS
jgi:ketosteroid isomerase-like protein